MHLLINIIGFQIGWFACVLGAANYVPLVGPIVVAVVVSFHLSQASRPLRELMLVCAAGLMGAVWDSALVTAGLLEYPSGNFLTGFAPFLFNFSVAMRRAEEMGVFCFFARYLRPELRLLPNALLHVGVSG